MVNHAASIHGNLRVEVFAKNTMGRRFYERYGFVEGERYTHQESGEVTVKLAMP